MKKYLALLLLALFPLNIYAAENTIYSIDQEIYIDQNGDATIQEIWKVDGANGTEWYKTINGLNDSRLTNFKVKMDDIDLQYKNWNVDESLKQKAGYYGINSTSKGIELCFGKSDYNYHIFTLSYKISNYIQTLEDSQVLYWTLIGSLSNVNFENFSVKITSYYDFPDTLDVWGFGYKGYAYVKDGAIYLQNEENTYMGNQYVVLLAKFPLSTFLTTTNLSEFKNFDEVLTRAKEGSFEYDYDEDELTNSIGGIITAGFWIFFLFLTVKQSIKINESKYGYANNKKINKKELNMFREIPCNKDIYYANTLLYLNKMDYKEANILGAIILKWVKEDKIQFINETKGIFKKESSSIDLRNKPTFTNELESKLFDIMYKASGDGILESKELEKWCRKNYDEFFKIFKEFNDKKVDELTASGEIRKRINRDECKKKNVLSEKIYEDSEQLYGLKLYLEEFASMNTKEVMEIKIWDEYLMFAYLFGIADKVAKQLKNLYPELLENMNYDFDTIYFINSLSSSSTVAASNARSAAQSYSSGGGGFSSGGGGGGSFGGGGGGSR